MTAVAILVGSASDLPAMTPCQDTLERFGVPVLTRVLSAHRTPDETAAFVRSLPERGVGVLIAAAGLAAHLPGVAAAYTALPVIGVPVAAGALRGVDALLSMAQMPPGVPVATVGIDAAQNAALLAVRILALGDADLARRLEADTRARREQVLCHELNRGDDSLGP